MTNLEWENFYNECLCVVLIVLPSAIAGLIVSLTHFLNRHFKQEPFSYVKLISGICKDMLLAIMTASISYGFGANHSMRLGLSIFIVARGTDWLYERVDSAIASKISEYKTTGDKNKNEKDM